MFKKILIKVNAENPQLPLVPNAVFEGSAASFGIMGVPRDIGKRKITGVAVAITNVAGVSAAYSAVENGGVWSVTVPAAAIGPSGSVGNGVMIEASGTDETGGDVPCWILGAGFLVVMKTDGTVAPGDPSITLHAYDVRPTHPRKWDIAPNPTTGALERFDGTAWVPFGSGGGGSDVLGKLPVKPLPKYLHALSFDDPYKADAEAWYDSLAPDAMGGACSAVRRGGKLYRNYDWTFDDAAEFVVRMSAAEGRHASVGIASLGAALTEDEVMSGVYTAKYRALPGMTLDGINDAGVVAEINVDGGPKTGWHGDAEDGGIHILAAVRWVLDKADRAAEAAEWLADHIIEPIGDINFHFMVADANETWIVENGGYALINWPGLAHVLTNFRVFINGSDGKSYYNPVPAWTLYHAGGGKERYDLLAGGADISAVHWTKAYAEGNDWHSDFESEAQHAAAIEQWAAQGTDKEAHRGKTTESGAPWWQTVHTSEYDFAAKTLRVAVQESGEYFTFAVGAKAEVSWGDVTGKPETFPPTAHTHPQSQVTGLEDALEAKRDNTDLAVYAYNILTPGRFGKDFIFTPNEAGHRLAWRVGELDDPEWAMIYYYDEHGIWVYTGSDDEHTIVGSPDDLVLSFAHIGTFTRSLDPNAGSLATTSQLPTAEQLLTEDQAAEIAKVKDKADEVVVEPEHWDFREQFAVPSAVFDSFEVVAANDAFTGDVYRHVLWGTSGTTRTRLGRGTVGYDTEAELAEETEITWEQSPIFRNTKTWLVPAVTKRVLRSGLDPDGVPLDPNVADFFGESNSLLMQTMAIPFASLPADNTTSSYKRFRVTVTDNMTIVLHTPTSGEAEIFECRFDGSGLAADKSISFSTSGATATTMDTDCGTVKAGKVALMSAFWNGTTWDVNWKVEG